jgi:formylglycine-generating enzyme required for sulfatase activity
MSSVMFQHLTETPDLAPLDGAEQTVLLKALAKDPDERYPSCAEFVRELTRVVQRSSPERGRPAHTGEEAGGPPALRRGRGSEDSTLDRTLGASTEIGSGTPPVGRTEEIAAPSWRPTSGRRRWLGPLLALAILGGAALGAAAYLHRSPQAAGSFDLGVPAPARVDTGGRTVLDIPVRRDKFREPIRLTFESLPENLAVRQVSPGDDPDRVRIEVRADQEADPVTRTIVVRADAAGRQKQTHFDLTVVLLPPGCSPVDDEIEQDAKAWWYYRRVVRPSPGGSPVEFVLVPEKRGQKEEARTFYIMADKVWVGLYREFADKAAGLEAKGWNKDSDDRHPALGMTGHDAERFAAAWLGVRGALPTLRQWDKAAGRYEDPRREGPFKGKWDTQPRPDVAIGGLRGPRRVGEARDDVSPFGCRDMSGNGLEWVRTGPNQDPELRGRSFEENEPLRFIDLEDPNLPGLDSFHRSQADLGFRVVLLP